MRCYEIAIGLDNLVYSAFTGHWAQLETVAERTLAISREQDSDVSAAIESRPDAPMTP